MNSTINNFSKFFSFVFHPLIMPSIGILILFNSNSYINFLTFDAKKIIFLIVFISTFLLPLLFVPFYFFHNIIKNLEMSNHKERIIPFATTSVVYLFCYFLLHRLAVPIIIESFILASFITILVLLIISYKWKISAHMIGIGGLAGTIVGFSFLLGVNLMFYLLPVIILSGLIASSRMILKTHNPPQVYSGWIIGFVVTSTSLLVLS